MALPLAKAAAIAFGPAVMEAEGSTGADGPSTVAGEAGDGVIKEQEPLVQDSHLRFFR